MRFRLTLQLKGGSVLPLNYQYPISAWIYKCIDRADSDFARFLHNKGYAGAKAGKPFKFFTFSKLQVPKFDIYEDRMIIKSNEVYLTLSFLVEQAAEKFVTGAFLKQQVGIGDKKSNVDFEIGMIEARPVMVSNELIVKANSPIVVSKPEVNKHGKLTASYLTPQDEEYKDYFLKNLINKYTSYASYTGERVVPKFSGEIEWELQNGKIRKSLQTIKANTTQETKVRGYEYSFSLKAPEELVRVGLLAGFGEKNSLGFGCGEVVKKYS